MSLIYPFERITVHTAPFTLQGDHLAVMMTQDEQGNLELPNTPLLPHHPDIARGDILTEAARGILYTSFQDARPTVEPLLLQGEHESDNRHFRIGYAAVARLVQISKPDGLTTVPLHRITDLAPSLSEFDQKTLRLGLQEVQPPKNLASGIALRMEKSLHILSRLVDNPRRFTIDELCTAYQALLQGALGPDEGVSQKQLDRPDFYRSVKNLPLIQTNVLSQSRKGRPAAFWSMPHGILNVSSTRKGWSF